MQGIDPGIRGQSATGNQLPREQYRLLGHIQEHDSFNCLQPSLRCFTVTRPASSSTNWDMNSSNALRADYHS